MAYEKHNWVNGEVIDADKLNRIEKGIADAGTPSIDTSTLETIFQNYIEENPLSYVSLNSQEYTWNQKHNVQTSLDLASASSLSTVNESLVNSISSTYQEAMTTIRNETTRAKDAESALSTRISAIPTTSVLYTSQTLTDTQKGIARTNIDAVPSSALSSAANSLGQSITAVSNSVIAETNRARTAEQALDDSIIKNAKDAVENAIILNDTENNAALAKYSTAEGQSTESRGLAAHAEGSRTHAKGDSSHAEGVEASADAVGAHAEGYSTKATEAYSHAEGYMTTASGQHAHAEGYNTKATGSQAHAEGRVTTASNSESHAEGNNTTASGMAAHAEGDGTVAANWASHAEGAGTHAMGDLSHAEGNGTTANHMSQHVFGEYNILDPSENASTIRGTYVEIVGNGTSSTRSNARTLDWNGNEVLSGKLTLGTQAVNDNDVPTLAQVRALIQEYLNNNNN